MSERSEKFSNLPNQTRVESLWFSLWRRIPKNLETLLFYTQKTLACWENNQLPVREGDMLARKWIYKSKRHSQGNMVGTMVVLNWPVATNVLKMRSSLLGKSKMSGAHRQENFSINTEVSYSFDPSHLYAVCTGFTVFQWLPKACHSYMYKVFIENFSW